MKKLLVCLAIAGSSCLAYNAQAQIHVSFNIGAQPAWGPTGYDAVQYYYIPDADAYYDVAHSVFYYQDGGRWINSPYLPGPYRNLDLYSVHKVVVNQPNPWLHASMYRSRYGHFRGMHDQMAIRDSHDERYYQNPGHPQHAQWMQHHGNNMHGNDMHGNNNMHGNDMHGNGNMHGNDMHGNGNMHGNNMHGNSNMHGNDAHGNTNTNGNNNGGDHHDRH